MIVEYYEHSVVKRKCYQVYILVILQNCVDREFFVVKIYYSNIL
jgi:hypothetical protein